MKLSVCPLSLRDARAFVAVVHRHHKPPQGGKFAIGAEDENSSLRAVVIVGRPVSRVLDDGRTAEVTRLASDGARNACSLLYAAAWRAARAMGYTRLITYTLAAESGASCRAAGFRLVGSSRGGSWSRADRQRTDTHPLEVKTRWEIAA